MTNPTSNQRLECNACDWKGPRSEAVHFKHDASVLLCPECKETTVQSTPLSSNGMTIQLENVARWLENKCDPLHAARELRLLVEQMRSVETSAPQAKLDRVSALLAMLNDPRQWIQNQWTRRIAAELRYILESSEEPTACKS